MTVQLNSRERKQVERLARGSRLVAFLVVASMQMRKFNRSLPKEFRYRSHEEFFLNHGRLYTPKSFPVKYRRWRGKPQACLYNAAELALSCPELDYVEGYALPANALIDHPVDHSWCVDGDGNVVDPTWYKTVGREYFGLAFNKDILVKQYKRGMPFGLLFNEALLSKIARGKMKDWRKLLLKGSKIIRQVT